MDFLHFPSHSCSYNLKLFIIGGEKKLFTQEKCHKTYITVNKIQSVMYIFTMNNILNLLLLFSDKKDEKGVEEKKNLEELEISFRNGKYCVHTLCECESVCYDYNTVIIFSYRYLRG
jgi:hypothetical protein